jgi:hypothetical protein
VPNRYEGFSKPLPLIFHNNVLLSLLPWVKALSATMLITTLIAVLRRVLKMKTKENQFFYFDVVS